VEVKRGLGRSTLRTATMKTTKVSYCFPPQCIAVVNTRLRFAVEWRDISIGPKLGSGRSAIVHTCQCAVGGSPAEKAIKLFNTRFPAGRQAYEQERGFYELLKDIQGQYIPKVHPWGVISPSGTAQGLLMELGEPMASSFSEWSPKEREQAVEAVTALSTGYMIVHGDVRPENFLKCNSGRVVAIDLEASVVEKDEAVRRTALQKAVAAIQGML
jgi:hypothetical protein